MYNFAMLYGGINSSNQSNYQSRRPDSVNVSHPSAKLMPSRNDTLIQTLPVNDVQIQDILIITIITHHVLIKGNLLVLFQLKLF